MIKSVTDFFAPSTSVKFYDKVLKDYKIMRKAIREKEKTAEAKD